MTRVQRLEARLRTLAPTHLALHDDSARHAGHAGAAGGAGHFDVVIVREDQHPRGRAPGEVAGLVSEGVRAGMSSGARCKQVEEVLDEIEAVRHAMARANAGDLVVICVDKHQAVMAELEKWSKQAYAGAAASADAPAADPDYVPAEPAASS